MNVSAHRSTRQRRLIYEVVSLTESHPTAEWVYAAVRRTLPRVSLGTVYRNLALLVAEGRLRSWTRGRTTRYDADTSAHDHFLCESCGMLLDLERAAEPLPVEKRLNARGYAVKERVLEFIGLCRECRRSPKKRNTGGEKKWLR